MSPIEFLVILTRAFHFSGIVAVVIVAIYGANKVGLRLYLSRTSIAFLFFLAIAFIVVFVDPTRIPGIKFVILLNALYGLAWWSSVKSHIGKVLYH